VRGAVAILDEHVRRLDVAVDDAALVQEREGLEELRGEARQGGGDQVRAGRGGGRGGREGRAARALLDEVPAAADGVVAEVEHASEVRVVEGGEDLELARESRQDRVGGRAPGARRRGRWEGNPLEGALGVTGDGVRHEQRFADRAAAQNAERAIAGADEFGDVIGGHGGGEHAFLRLHREWNRCRTRNVLINRQRIAPRLAVGGSRGRRRRRLVRHCNHDRESSAFGWGRRLRACPAVNKAGSVPTRDPLAPVGG
jgi:hypothetical protein